MADKETASSKASGSGGLVAKLARVMAAVERVAKNGRNEFHRYDYATERDITSAIRSALAAEGVMLLPSVEKVEFTTVATSSRAGAAGQVTTF